MKKRIITRFALALLLAGFMSTALATDRYNTIAGLVALWSANLGAGPGWEAEFTTLLNEADDVQLNRIEAASDFDAVRAILLGRGRLASPAAPAADLEAPSHPPLV